MKRFILLLPLILMAACGRKEDWTDGDTPLEGRWAETDAFQRSGIYYEFSGGTYRIYESESAFLVAGGSMWRAKEDDFINMGSGQYSVFKGQYFQDGIPMGEFSIDGDTLRVGEKKLLAFDKFGQGWYSTVVPKETAIDCPFEGKSYAIEYAIDNPLPWTEVDAETSSDWIYSLEAGDGKVSFTVGENLSGESRKDIIILSCTEAESVYITVEQQCPQPSIVIDPQSLDAPCEGGVFSIAYKIEYPSGSNTLQVSSQASWVEDITQSDNQVTFRIGSNEGKERTTVVSFQYASAYVECLIRQSGKQTDRTVRWAELPFILDADNDGMDDNDADIYYASHLCAGGETYGHNGKTARNYTVCFSAEHHCPLWVAAPRHEMYESGADRTDAYAPDPKIPSEIQYSSKSTGGGCNKGHMLGSAERLSSYATNRQVFYYSNIAPQLSATFNTGGGAWNNLEDFVDTQVCRDTLYEVVGCYFEVFEDAYGKSCSPQTITFGGRNDVTRPSMFYYVLLRTKSGSSGKAVSECRPDELKCVAFVLRHNMDKGHKPQRNDMMSVEDLEALTGFTYFHNVPNAPKDTFNPSDWGL